MFKMHEVREIIRLMEQSSIREIVITGEDSHIALRRRSGSAISEAPQNLKQVKNVAVPISKPAPVSASAKPISVVPTSTVTSAKINMELAKEIDTTNETLHKIVSPMVGTFYQAPAVDADPYVKVGDKVTKSTIVCIVEAMKLFNEIEAEVDGEIVQVLVRNGQLVEHGQPLFLIKTE